eukprot:937637-Rhodomonas_salina.1
MRCPPPRQLPAGQARDKWLLEETPRLVEEEAVTEWTSGSSQGSSADRSRSMARQLMGSCAITDWQLGERLGK